MKISQDQTASSPSSTRKQNKFHALHPRLPKSRAVRTGLFLLGGLGLVLFAFASGAYAYRSGVLTPLTAFVKALSQGDTSKLPEGVTEAGKSIQDEIRMYVDNGLPTLYLDIKFDDYQQLLEKRSEALQIGILNTTDADFVPLELHLSDGPNLEGKIRLKGDWTDHLQEDKWSFRIHLKDDGQIYGMKQFSLQSPERATIYMNGLSIKT